ncbi:MAG: NAD+ synthase [Candidatus Omnitrophica bacterium]|nr:NAD+ synthase [Candidatus Omnitrophota bacterium]
MRIALAQINPTVGDLDGNRHKIAEYIRRARDLSADIVAFPECALCGYPPEDLLLKKHFVRDNLKTLRFLIAETKHITAIVGFIDPDAAGNIYNAAAVISQGKLAGVYRKEHLPNYGVFDEKRYFSPGEQNPVWLFDSAPVGVSICEDIWPADGSHIWQAAVGVRVMINISSSPYEMGKLATRRKLVAARAKDAGVYFVYVNLVGGQDELVFDGGSCVMNPCGKMIAAAKAFAEDILFVDIDPLPGAIARRERRTVMGLTSSAESGARAAVPNRIEPAQSKIERVYRALVLGTRDYVAKNGFKKVVLGLSGGIDSALVAAIAVDAVGRENVVGVTMPSQFTSGATLGDAKRLAANLNIELVSVAIKPVYDRYLEQLAPEFAKAALDVTEENLQARIRGNLLMAFSNKKGWLVLTTGNKSEMAVGYCTLYGDMSGGFAVIKDVLKTTVYALAAFKNAAAGYDVIPRSVIERPPTAELKANQKDQDTLPPYDVLDEILKAYVEESLSLAAIVKKFGQPDVVRRVVRMVDLSEYKRRQSPPGVKITPRAFGKDWRLPITNGYRE